MAVLSQNGWQAATTYTGHGIPLTSLRWVTGTVRSGDVHTVLDYLGERFHREVEPIRKTHSWGFAPRQIRGASTTLSNHASGTAVDFNAPDHGLGKSGTFTPTKVRAIERILDDLGGVVRWGGHYSARKDEMHFEVNCSPAQLARVADKIRKGSLGAPTPATPTTTIPTTSEEDDMYIVSAKGSKGFYLLRGSGPLLPLTKASDITAFRKAGVKDVELQDWASLENLIDAARGA